MAITAWSAMWFLPFALPISIWVAWSDMKFMKIPNKAVIALMAVFLVVGLIALPLGEYGWRLTHFVVVLTVGFVLNMAGAVGAGDAKFAAAMAPMIALGDAQVALFLFAAVLLTAFVVHRFFRAFPKIRSGAPDWKSWTSNKFPMGLTLVGTLLFYLIAGVAAGA
jgi:prepilin peptidase CpaA